MKPLLTKYLATERALTLGVSVLLWALLLLGIYCLPGPAATGAQSISADYSRSLLCSRG